MSKLTVTIPDDLHQKIREELERQGTTTSQFIEQAVTTFFEKPKGVSNIVEPAFYPRLYSAPYAVMFAQEKSESLKLLYGAVEHIYNLPPFAH